MRKHLIVVILVVLLVILLVIIIGPVKHEIDNSEDKVCFGSSCFNVEIADDAQSRELGLMYGQDLGDNDGMLFVFESEGRYSFWMKNTLIPLDMIWLDKDLKVVDIRENVQPCHSESCESYTPNIEALYVLEVNAGKTRSAGIGLGDSAKLIK